MSVHTSQDLDGKTLKAVQIPKGKQVDRLNNAKASEVKTRKNQSEVKNI
jgi:hypothetical protein